MITKHYQKQKFHTYSLFSMILCACEVFNFKATVSEFEPLELAWKKLHCIIRNEHMHISLNKAESFIVCFFLYYFFFNLIFLK